MRRGTAPAPRCSQLAATVAASGPPASSGAVAGALAGSGAGPPADISACAPVNGSACAGGCVASQATDVCVDPALGSCCPRQGGGALLAAAAQSSGSTAVGLDVAMCAVIT
mmetsp:Transcript_85454/g.276725  ORF Transcript_85454/g.276725 Transcript_85454/m.276725 type:complete len:111 (-) Transcript_85454:986-1318(-)